MSSRVYLCVEKFIVFKIENGISKVLPVFWYLSWYLWINNTTIVKLIIEIWHLVLIKSREHRNYDYQFLWRVMWIHSFWLRGKWFSQKIIFQFSVIWHGKGWKIIFQENDFSPNGGKWFSFWKDRKLNFLPQLFDDVISWNLGEKFKFNYLNWNMAIW